MPSKQFVSYQRTYIKPVLFQNINKKYLKLIDYKNDNRTFKTFKGIRLYDYYESDFKYQISPKTQAEFNTNQHRTW